jgi:hypothetical protein
MGAKIQPLRQSWRSGLRKGRTGGAVGGHCGLGRGGFIVQRREGQSAAHQRSKARAVPDRGGERRSTQEEKNMATKSNRTKSSVKNRAKGKQVAAKRKKVRHLKSIKKGMRAR